MGTPGVFTPVGTLCGVWEGEPGASTLTSVDKTQFRWLTSDQVETKLRLGLKGPVGSLFELHSTSPGSIASYIPENRRLTLVQAQANRVLASLQRVSSTGEYHYTLPTTLHFGTDVHVYAWGIMFLDELYVFRLAQNVSGVCQIWCVRESSGELDVATDPVVDYVMSLPYIWP